MRRPFATCDPQIFRGKELFGPLRLSETSCSAADQNGPKPTAPAGTETRTNQSRAAPTEMRARLSPETIRAVSRTICTFAREFSLCTASGRSWAPSGLDMLLAVCSNERVFPFCRSSPPRRMGPQGSALTRLDQRSMAMRRCRVTDTSRRPPIGWPQRAPVGQRPHLTPGARGRHLRCRRYDEAAGLLSDVVACAPHC